DARGLLYVGSGGDILVFDGLDTLAGDVAPTRTLDANSFSLDYLALDPARDVLYASNGSSLQVFADASTLSGSVSPTATLAGLGGPQDLALDTRADRLWVSAEDADRVLVFDDASTLTSLTNPD